MKTLLNFQWIRWVVCAIFIPIVYFWAYQFFEPIQYTLITYMPGALISLMGFLIAGASIIVAMRGQGVLKDFADTSPKNWDLLMKQFFRASRYCVSYALYLLFSDAVPLGNEDSLGVKLIYSFSAAGFILVVLQLSMAIASLEQASLLSSRPSQSSSQGGIDKSVAPIRRIFKRPDPNARVYEPKKSSGENPVKNLKQD